MTPRPAPAKREIFVSRDGVRWVIADPGSPTETRRRRRVKLNRLDPCAVGRTTKLITVACLLSFYERRGMLPAGAPMHAPAPKMDKEHLRAWNMRRIRTDRRMTIDDMHARTGISDTFLMEMERCTRAISIKTIDRLAAGLGMAPAGVLAELDRPPVTAR